MDLALAHTNATAVFEFVFASKMAIRQMFGRTVHHWVTDKKGLDDLKGLKVFSNLVVSMTV